MIFRILLGSQIIASDIDSGAFARATELQKSHPDSLWPVRFWFSQMVQVLGGDLGLRPGSFDGVIVDAGVSDAQWETGFNPAKNG